MTPERFTRLIEAYGADPGHWPQEWRADAELLVRHGDAVVVRALEDARALDAALSSHRVRPADAELTRRIVASRRTPSWWRQAGRRTRWALSGAVLVGAGMGGVAAGALAISLAMPLSTVAASATGFAEAPNVGTAFGDVGVVGSEQ